MDIEATFDDELARRLPLPLAQLYRRAHNAKGARDRHDTAYCLWEAALKLLGATAVVAYAERGAPAPELTERLRNLARPALGHWWEFVRLLVPLLAEAGDEGFSAARDLVLGRSRDDLPRPAALDTALREALDGPPAGHRATVRLSELFDRLVRYRNREIGHGAAGQRSAEFYERMGRALQLGVPELLGRLDVLAGRRLIAVTDVRGQTSGAWLIERHELLGESPRRLPSEERPESDAARLPRTGRLYLVAPGSSADDVPTWSLHPLVLYSHESEEVFFLNARRGRRRAEYLCYYPGRTEDRTDLGGERRELLADVLGVSVDEEQADEWAAQSQSEEPPSPPPAVEPRRLGEFELLSELGRGGMGVVYRAWQPSLGRQVALKSLLRAGDPKAEARFNREIHALGRVEHPNLVKVFTSGIEVDRWFYAMELIEGATLGAVCGRLQGRGSSVTELDMETWREMLSSACQEARAAEKPLSADEPVEERPARARLDAHPPSGAAGRDYVRHVVDLVRQVAEAAHALHESGVIHRDIKPDNVLVTPDGAQAVLMDLGLAQLADETEGRLTRTRQFVGTLRYASPEQVLSVPLDRRSDVYSLGATLWELLTLRPMFGATELMPTPDLMLKVQSSDPERPRRLNPRVPEDLEAIVLKCLEKDRGRRYSTAQDLADDLSRWLRGEPVQAQPPTLGYLVGKSLRRHRVAVALASACVLALVLGGVAAVSLRVAYRLDRLRQTAESARSLAQTERDRANAERDHADQARLGEAVARAKEAEARKSAEGLKEELRLRLVQKVDVANGVKLMDQGDLFGSLAWFADAARLELGDPRNAGLLRVRLNSIVMHGPKVSHVLFHDGPLLHADFSPDGRRIVTAGGARTARVWDADTGQPLSSPLKYARSVKHAFFSPDGRSIVTASDDGTARVWDADTEKPVTAPFKHGGLVDHASFSADGRRIVTVTAAFGAGGHARVWDAATGQPLAPPLEDGGLVSYAAFSPDGRRVVTLAKSDTVTVWDVATGRPLARVTHYGQLMWHASFSPDGHRIVTSEGYLGQVGGAWVLDADTGRVVAILGHERWVKHASFSPDGRRVVTASDDRTARVWDAATGQLLTRPLRHEGTVGDASFSPDGRRIVTASADHTARLWDAVTGQPVTSPLKHGEVVCQAAFGPDGRRVVTASVDGTARVWDTATGQPLTSPLRHEVVVFHPTYSPDGRRIVTASLDGAAQVWDAATGQAASPPMKHDLTVLNASFSPDGRCVVTASADGTARVWDATTGQPVTPPLKHEAGVYHASFSPDGRRIVTVSMDRSERTGRVWVWEVATGQSLSPPLMHRRTVIRPSFSPDGRRIITAGDDGTARVWDADTGKAVAPPLEHKRELWDASFSPDGRRILTAGADGTARVWDAATGQAACPPMRHVVPVLKASFSPDGRHIVTASSDETAQVWDATTGQPATPPLKHEAVVSHASFSPDGHQVVTASQDRTARLWDADTGQPLTPPLRHEGAVAYASYSPDGRRVVTASSDRKARVWEAGTERRLSSSVGDSKDLFALSHLLAGAQVDPSGELVALAPDQFRALWQDLRPRYPEVFVCSPEEILSWNWREAAGCEEAEAWPWAVVHLDALIATNAASWQLLARRGRAYAELGRWRESIGDASKAIALRSAQDELWKLEGLWLLRGNAHAELGEWKEAAADLTRAIEDAGGDPVARIGLALVHLKDGDLDKYRDACARLLRDFRDRMAPYVASALAWACALAPEAVADREVVLRWAQARTETDWKDSGNDELSSPERIGAAIVAQASRLLFRSAARQSLPTIGGATNRTNSLKQAIGRLNAAVSVFPLSGNRASARPDQQRAAGEALPPLPPLPRLEPDPNSAEASLVPITRGDALAWLFLSMAHHRLGHRDEARKWLDKAVAAIDRATQVQGQGSPDGAAAGSRINWKTRLAYRVLRSEAESMINAAGASGPEAPAAKDADQRTKTPK
jgi:WD40 repeat protein/serine/threonine protein kinase/tetratricopeptide (TPR) repeat protein